eukprot:1157314-Pelagomonas_calceolata.AAC.3
MGEPGGWNTSSDGGWRRLDAKHAAAEGKGEVRGGGRMPGAAVHASGDAGAAAACAVVSLGRGRARGSAELAKPGQAYCRPCWQEGRWWPAG